MRNFKAIEVALIIMLINTILLFIGGMIHEVLMFFSAFAMVVSMVLTIEVGNRLERNFETVNKRIRIGLFLIFLSTLTLLTYLAVS